MPRIRTIKPEIGLHEELYELEQETELPIRFAWAVLPCHCDREGRFQWRPRPLGAQILPYDGVDFSRVLDALAARGFLVKYRVGDAWYGAIPTFHRHQVVNNRERESELPSVEGADEVFLGGNQQDADASSTRGERVDYANVTPLEQDQAEGKGREGKGRDISPDGDTSPAPADGPSPCPHQKIIELYHEILPELPTVRSWTEKRKRYLAARWREDPERQTLDWWRAYFEYIRGCPFLMGQTDPGPGRSVSFLADLEWIVTSGNFVKIIEGKYEPRGEKHGA